MTHRLMWVGRLLVCLIGIWVLWISGLGAYRAFDRAGYIRHRQDTVIYEGGSWTLDEYCQCEAEADAESGKLNSLACDTSILEAEEMHVPVMHAPVVFWGRIQRHDKIRSNSSHSSGWLWRCRAKADSITCWALN